MISFPIEASELRLLQPEVIWLEEEDFDWAKEISDRVTGEERQWQTYLNGLALLSFERWLDERDASIPVERDCCSVLQPKYANAIEAVCNLRMGDFNLCLIATESLLDETINIPQAAVDLPEFAAHFYVVLEVAEEQEQVILRGFLRHDQLVSYRRAVNLQAERDWSYRLPLSLFNPEPNRLLHYARLLEPTVIPLPVTATNRLATPSLTSAELEALSSKLQSPEPRLWQCLTWEQGAVILKNPELLDLLYRWQAGLERTVPFSIRLREVFALLTQKAIDAAQWFQGELDEFAQSLELFSSQNLTLAPELCRSIDQFEMTIAQLRDAGMKIPPDVNPIYQNIDLNGMPLQLCAVSWPISPRDCQKWSLLTMLGMQSGGSLPDEMKLRVSNLTGILREPVSELDDPFLVARVEGDWDEKFVVTIVPAQGSPLTLQPYTFSPEQPL